MFLTPPIQFRKCFAYAYTWWIRIIKKIKKKKTKTKLTEHMTVKFSHLNFYCHHEIFPQFKAKKGDVSRSDYLHHAALTEEYWSLKTVLQSSPNIVPLLYFVPTLVRCTQFLPKVTWKNIFPTSNIGVNQHKFWKHLFSI